MIRVPKPVNHHRSRGRRPQSPAQKAAIRRSKELCSVQDAGGGRALAKQVLAPVKFHSEPEWTRKAEVNPLVNLKLCALCGKQIGKAAAAWYCYALAHESCVRNWLEKLGFQLSIIECEVAIRRRLAAEIKDRERTQ